jgi:methionyl-tRNA synthetase
VGATPERDDFDIDGEDSARPRRGVFPHRRPLPRLLRGAAMSRFYVTTPIYYVNDVPHLGHAYTTIVADTLARYHRMRGEPTMFLTGTDEHGQKIERVAKEHGVTPQSFVADLSEKFRTIFSNGPLATTPNDFIRTTEQRHVETTQELWRKCVESGAIYEGTYEGLYCVGCEAYYTEKELTASPEGPRCPIHTTVVERLTEPTYFFKLSAYQQRLLEFYEKHPEFIQPESRRNEVLSFVRGGLDDLSVSRTGFSWGIPVPDDGGAANGAQHVMYVWFDALTNYLSATMPESSSTHAFWPPNVQLIGKDILRFHAVYWPAFLMAAGYSDARLPKTIFAHGWLTINGQKMSKSLRNVVEPVKLAEVFGADVVRFYLMREVAFGQDGDFSHVQLIARYNSELADGLGNLLNRTLGLCTKLRAGVASLDAKAGAGPLEEKLMNAAIAARSAFEDAMKAIAPHRALDEVFALVRAGNKYIDESAPWAEAKKPNNEARVDAILATALETLRWLSTLIAPFMPAKSAGMRAQLGLSPVAFDESGSDAIALLWQSTFETGALAAGTPLFPKWDADAQAEKLTALGLHQLEAPEASKATVKVVVPEKPKKKEPEAPPAQIAFEDFAKVDLRVGVVLSAERLPKSDKLLKVQVDLGELGQRQVLAGIGKAFTPDQLVGKQVVVVANLAPRMMMGQESRGMILAVRGESGESDLALLSPDKARAPGSRVS